MPAAMLRRASCAATFLSIRGTSVASRTLIKPNYSSVTSLSLIVVVIA